MIEQTTEGRGSKDASLLDTVKGNIQPCFWDRVGERGRRACSKARMFEQSANFQYCLLEHRFPGTNKLQELTLQRKMRVLL